MGKGWCWSFGIAIFLLFFKLSFFIDNVYAAGCCQNSDCDSYCTPHLPACTDECNGASNFVYDSSGNITSCYGGTCAWSVGNTCTDWCNNGSCVAGSCSGGYCINQVCCDGHVNDTQNVSCTPGGGGGGGSCAAGCYSCSCGCACGGNTCADICTGGGSAQTYYYGQIWADCNSIYGWYCYSGDFQDPQKVLFYSATLNGTHWNYNGWNSNLTTWADLSPSQWGATSSQASNVVSQCGGYPNRFFSVPLPDTYKDGNTYNIYFHANYNYDLGAVISGCQPGSSPTPPDLYQRRFGR